MPPEDPDYSNGRPTHLIRRVPFRLRIRQADRDLARFEIAASIAMVFLAALGDVDGLGLWVRAGCGRLVSTNRECDRTK